MIKRFDLVSIKTVNRVKWLSGPASRPATPQGNWVVICGVGKNELMLSKDETLIRIPISDVFKVADYGVDHAIRSVKDIRTISDMSKHKLSPLKEFSNG